MKTTISFPFFGYSADPSSTIDIGSLSIHIYGLLIGLGLADVSYGKWFKWSIKFQLLNLLLTGSLLLLGLAVGY